MRWPFQFKAFINLLLTFFEFHYTTIPPQISTLQAKFFGLTLKRFKVSPSE